MRAPPSLRRRLIRQIGLMIGGLIIVSLGTVCGINGLRSDFGGALQGYQDLRSLYEIGLHVSTARAALSDRPARPEAAISSIALALAESQLGEGSARDASLELSLTQARGMLTTLETSGLPATILDPALARVAALSAGIRQSIQQSQTAAERTRVVTLWVVIAVNVAVIALGVLIGVRQYQSTMGPLNRLRGATRRLAAGRFDERIDAAKTDLEFSALADDFNRMAAELQSVYTDLEHRVQVASRQLVQSDRLASVGYLAAGVAHEINNPLGIIAGFGERSLQRLDRGLDAQSSGQIRKSIQVMCDEAFCCKQITDRLLMLARPGNEGRVRVSLPKVAEDVVTSLSALSRFADRQLVVKYDAQAALEVVANEGEMRQVLLNLITNALEAVPARSGRVDLSIVRDRKHVELSVADNGRGMDAATVGRVFEPFFTEKRAERVGTGLGLSVAHAIVHDHHGQIEAQSDGPGRGSRFVVRFPIADVLVDSKEPSA